MNGLGLHIRCISGKRDSRECEFPDNFVSPMMEPYDGTSDQNELDRTRLGDKPQPVRFQMVLKCLKPKGFSPIHQDPPRIDLVAREAPRSSEENRE